MRMLRARCSVAIVVLAHICSGGVFATEDLSALFRQLESAETEDERSRIEKGIWTEMRQPIETGEVRPALPALVEGLQSQDAGVRGAASALISAAAMSSMNGGRAVATVAEELVKKLGDPDPQVRANLTLAIAWTQPAPPDSAESVLRELLIDQNIEVRRHGVSALSRLASPDPETIEAVRRLAESNKAGNDTALRALGAFGRATPEVLQVFVGALKESDMARKMAALNGLRQLGAGAEAALPEIERLAASASESDVVRRNAEATLNAIRKD